MDTASELSPEEMAANLKPVTNWEEYLQLFDGMVNHKTEQQKTDFQMGHYAVFASDKFVIGLKIDPENPNNLHVQGLRTLSPGHFHNICRFVIWLAKTLHCHSIMFDTKNEQLLQQLKRYNPIKVMTFNGDDIYQVQVL